MAIQYYMNYTIFFQDEVEYQFALSIAGGALFKSAPRDAATLFGIPFPYPSGDTSAIDKGIYFYSPFNPGTEIFFPGASGIFVDDTILSVTVPGQAGNPASIWPAGPDGIFTWSGNIVLNAAGSEAAAVQAYTSPPNMSQRRWVVGGELAPFNEGGSALPASCFSRDASRTIEGMGWMIRGNIYSSALNRIVNDFRPGLNPRTSWERFYVRFRALPTAFDVGFWRTFGSPNANAGSGLKFMQTGTVDSFDIDAISGEHSKGTVFTPTLNQWYLIDILEKYGSGASPGVIQIYIDHVFAFTYTDPAAVGMGVNTRHVNSQVGKWSSGAEHECEIDFDDWICSDLPSNCNASSLNFNNSEFPLDWVLGSHVRLHHTLSASQTGWTPAGGAVGSENNGPNPESQAGTAFLVSVTSGATLEGLTDAVTLAETDTLAIVAGAVSGVICLRNTNASNTDGTLGYKKAGGAAVVTTIDQTVLNGTDFASYNVSTGIPMVVPDEISPWSTVHNKSADAASSTVSMMLSIVEYLGLFGEEDNINFTYPISRLTFLHNAMYANSMWGYLGSQPEAPVYAVGGTYVGNGSYQEVTLPAACQFLWIRATTGTSQGIKMFGAAPAGNLAGLDRIVPNVRMWYDIATETFKFGVTGGTASECNVNGTTYQYVAFCDPGMRFSLCGAYSHDTSTSTPKANPLIAGTFLANAAFIQRNQNASGSNAVGLSFKGPGSTANAGTDVSGVVQTNLANFTAGFLNTFADAHGSSPFTYSLWRTADSGGICAGVMVQILTYTGNGSSPRNITLTPTSGRFPLLVCVVPANASAGFQRDPSHTGSNSSNLSSGTVSTAAITGTAIDQITVNSALNANGIVYNVFAICGDITNVNGEFIGDYCNGDGPYIAPLPNQGDIIVFSEGGIDLDGTTPTTLLRSLSGIYTLVPGLRHDTLYDRQTGVDNQEVAIPDPTFKTGYTGG